MEVFIYLFILLFGWKPLSQFLIIDCEGQVSSPTSCGPYKEFLDLSCGHGNAGLGPSKNRQKKKVFNYQLHSKILTVFCYKHEFT